MKSCIAFGCLRTIERKESNRDGFPSLTLYITTGVSNKIDLQNNKIQISLVIDLIKRKKSGVYVIFCLVLDFTEYAGLYCSVS